MTSSNTPLFCSRTYGDMLAGKREAIAWGVTDTLATIQAKGDISIRAIIDGRAPPDMQPRKIFGIDVVSPEILLQRDPDKTAVVFSAPERYWNAIVRHVKSYGDFPVTLPHTPGRHDEEASGQWETEFFQEFFPRRQQALETFSRPRKIALWVHGLVPGGAERQIVLLAVGLRKQGCEVALITRSMDHPKTASWGEALAAAGVRRIVLSTSGSPPLHIGNSNSQETLLRRLAEYCLPLSIPTIVNAYQALRDYAPDALICYLDQGNTTTGIAGVLAGVPLIHMSGRNVSPLNFPEHTEFGVEKDRLHRLYRLLGSLPGITLSNNSHAGAASYAEWLDVGQDRIPVIRNAFVPFTQLQHRNLHETFGLPSNAPVIVGAMRLDEEKDPLGFVDIVARCHRQLNTVRAVIIGDGYLRSAVQMRIDELGLSSVILLAGHHDRPFEFFSSAGLLLLSSRMEGTPNVILEAQSLGCPVVATDVGGTREIMAPGIQNYAFRHGAWAEMADACAQLLSNSAEAQRASSECKAHVESFSDEAQLAKESLRVLSSWRNYQMPRFEQ